MNRIMFGYRIMKKRRELGLTQEQLAKRCGIVVSFMGHIERGSRSPSIETLVDIASALGCTVGELLGEENPAEAENQSLREALARIEAQARAALAAEKKP